MISKAGLEKYLQVNGVSLSASPDEIKTFLRDAKWYQDDIDVALMVLREESPPTNANVLSPAQALRRNQRLRPETISSLLGITVDMNYSIAQEQKNNRVVGIVVSVAVAVGETSPGRGTPGRRWRCSRLRTMSST